MKTLLVIIAFLSCFNIFSQKVKTQYFLINKKDILIERQLATEKNNYEGYLIIDEKRIKELNRTPNVEGRVWTPENDDDFHQFGYSFTFNRKNDTIVSKSYLETINIIKDRRQFLDVNKNLDEVWTEFIFIESINCNKFVLRKVRPLIFE